MTSLFADARSGHPKTKCGTLLLRLIAAAEILLALVLAPLAALWYGLHEMPEWFGDIIPPAAKTLWRGKSGPYRGVVW